MDTPPKANQLGYRSPRDDRADNDDLADARDLEIAKGSAIVATVLALLYPPILIGLLLFHRLHWRTANMVGESVWVIVGGVGATAGVLALRRSGYTRLVAASMLVIHLGVTIVGTSFILVYLKC